MLRCNSTKMKLTLNILLLLSFCSSLFAAETFGNHVCISGHAAAEYDEKTSGNKPERVAMTLKNGIVYIGDFYKKRPHGTGKAIYKNGDVYEGSFVKGKRSGEGKMSFKNGNVYEGNFYKDSLDGDGKLTFADGRVFTGCWKNGEKHGFGRMEKFNIGNGVTMILVKNPAGFTQVLNYLSDLNYCYDLMCCLDDRLADGEDVSWIWDVPFENLASHERLIGNVYIAGRRKGDMYLRMKYAGFDPAKLKAIKDDRSFAAKLDCRSRPLFILPTYSAMMRLRPVLTQKSRSKEFWE